MLSLPGPFRPVFPVQPYNGLTVTHRERLMTAIRGYDTPGALPSQSLPRMAKADTGDQNAITQQASDTPPSQDTRPDSGGGPLLSSMVQSTLLATQAADNSATSAPSANQIAAADILALDTVHALDSNHNGTLSGREIAAVSPLVAVASTSLDSNNDGQISAGEISSAILSR